jgi:hypothetical protein
MPRKNDYPELHPLVGIEAHPSPPTNQRKKQRKEKQTKRKVKKSRKTKKQGKAPGGSH